VRDPFARLSEALSDRYRIERELGQGGMATVYLAEDLKHDRKVAVKVLRPELAAVLGAERFVTEIKTTASLQHPHILPLFDSGEAEGFLYYVMPYIEGETLRDKLNRETQLGVDEAVKITAEVADALDYAHRQGVIHRDIKPENILLHDGRPMVADFGIALAVSAAAGGRITETGLSLGTPHYMSPEQATAEKDITARSDVYSLAAVLYELLAGDPPHTGSSAQAIIMKIVTEAAAPVSRVRKTVPVHVADATSKALEKLPADRFETARQFGEALNTPSFRYGVAGAAASPTASRSATGRATAALGWVAAAILGAALLWPSSGAETRSDAPSFSVLVDTLGAGVAVVAFAEGGALVFASQRTIYVRRPDSVEPIGIHDDSRIITDLAASPDGRWVAFSTGGEERQGLYKVPVAGGRAEALLEDVRIESRSVEWAENGWIYFRQAGALARIPEDGGVIDTVLADARGLHPWDVLPDGRGLLMLTSAGPAVMDLDSGDTAVVLPGVTIARWSPTGHLVYPDLRGSMYAVPFDLERLRVTGEPREVLEGVATNAPIFDISRDGTLVYHAGARGIPGYGRQEYYWMEADGSTERIPIETVEGHTDGSLSPDGARLAYIREGSVHVFDLDRGTDLRLAPGGHDPVWSPDGREIAYREDGLGAVFAVASDGSGATRMIAELVSTSPEQWLGDGTILLHTFNRDVLAVDASSTTPPRNLLVATWGEHSATVSPDRRLVAYASEEDGAYRGYVREWPGLGRKTLVTGGDTVSAYSPAFRWARGSRELYYVRASGELAVVTVGANGSPSSRRTVTGLGAAWLQDLDTVGSRFLVKRSALGAATPDGLPEPNRLMLLTNFTGELSRRMGEGG